MVVVYCFARICLVIVLDLVVFGVNYLIDYYRWLLVALLVVLWFGDLLGFSLWRHVSCLVGV